jgi:signal transduction histidine kinase/CheY-like chemotaxis protein
MSVRTKLMRVVLMTTALALGVAGVAMLGHELYVYRTSWANDISTEAGILAWSSAPALAFDDHAAAERNLFALEPRRRVVVAALYTAGGQPYARFVRDGEAPPPAHPPADGIWARGEHVEIARPVERNGERVGTIYLRARYDVEGKVTAYAGIFGIAMLLSLSAAFVLSTRMQKSITEPLEAIARVARAVVRGRDYSLRAPKISEDEIGDVVDAFNKMLDEVQTRSRAMSDADRRKDEFLATLAHELRNPLAPVRHAVKLLETEQGDPARQRWAREVISRQVQRMALLLDDLLDVSRITRGRLDLKPETVELHTLIRAAVETARPLIEAKGHHLTIDVPPQPMALHVDPLRMSQSLSNLLTNAAKYTDAGGDIALSVRITDAGIDFSVRDNGIGFDPGMLSELFEMFSQVDTALTRSEGGLGIGLALVRGLVGLHGGSVEASSPGPGRGSEFTIHLPAALRVTPLPATPSAARPAGTVAAPGSSVLVADDNRDAADSLAMLLEMNGHRVSVAHCGERAFEAAERARPSAVILDIGMPDLSGYEVARRIRAESWGAPMLLVAVTGWGQADDKARARAAGFDFHLTKPVDPDQVERLINERRTPAPP